MQVKHGLKCQGSSWNRVGISFRLRITSTSGLVATILNSGNQTTPDNVGTARQCQRRARHRDTLGEHGLVLRHPPRSQSVLGCWAVDAIQTSASETEMKTKWKQNEKERTSEGLWTNAERPVKTRFRGSSFSVFVELFPDSFTALLYLVDDTIRVLFFAFRLSYISLPF